MVTKETITRETKLKVGETLRLRGGYFSRLVSQSEDGVVVELTKMVADIENVPELKDIKDNDTFMLHRQWLLGGLVYRY